MRVRPVKTHKCQNSIVFFYWAWLTGLDRKLTIGQIYTRNTKLVLPKIVLHDFEQLLFFCAFWYEKVLFVMKRVLDVMKICLKSWKSSKYYCFVKLNLTNRFGKENSQFTKNIRKTQNWSYQKMFCIILSNFWFLCFWYEKVLYVMKNVLGAMEICLKSWKSQKYYCFGKLNLTNRFGKETPNSPKIYAKHKIGPTKNCFA